jgi:Fe-S-cluster-containing dehydrogenase component
MSRKSFLFDLNKCVGCHACVVACTIENQTLPETIWREINSFNPSGHPDIPLFHYSLACNHCDDPPCLNNCPALAYSKDFSTGAVLHFADKCIGCKYCTWACPYDAPKFNETTKVIEKCTFCNHRIEEGLKPACANLCPTGALDFIDKPANLDHSNIPGFTDAGIQPSIKIIKAKGDKPSHKREHYPDYAMDIMKKEAKSKITFAHEWPLAIFTLLAALLVSVFSASVFGKVQPEPYSFIGAGVIGMLLSLFHLGKKLRAWRAILNLKKSWLSREIFFFGAFWGLSSIHLLFYQDELIAWAAAISGIIALFSIDKVYQLAIQPTPIEMHSAHVFLSFFLFTSLFFESYLAFAFVALIKVGLYSYRKLYFRKNNKRTRMLLSAWRLDMIISFPLLFWLFDISNIFWWIFASVLIGEMIDRAEYYNELDVITPKKQIEKDLKRLSDDSPR